MERLSICRICLDNNIQHVIEDPQLHELYERLTKVPFQTDDMRPLTLCYICHAQLSAARRLTLKCLKAEEILTNALNQVTNDAQVLNPVIDRSSLQQLSFTVVPVIFDNASVNLDDPKEEMLKIYETNVELDEVMQEIVNSMDFKLDVDYKQSVSEPGEEAPVNDILVLGEEQTVGDRVRKRRRGKRAAGIAKKPKLKSKLKTIKSEANTLNNNDVQDSRIQSNIKKHFLCDKCNRVFKEKCYLIAHACTQTYHPYSCDVCCRSFTAKRQIIKHSRNHLPFKPFPCNLCEKSFCERIYLKLHSRVHSDLKPFACSVCKKCFKTKSGLNTHSRVHTGERPYGCNVCEKRFTVFGDVVKHVRIHTGEKPYVCTVCDKSFNQNSSLKMHVRNMHVKRINEKPETKND